VNGEANSTPVDVVEQVEAGLVEAALQRIGGGVHVSELARKTGLTETQVIEALFELEEQGRATPWAWTLGPESTR
jgi:predicted Rossmann fold nucleotide-binding protein DprA/Smf involved in DNA uptake